MLYHAFFCVFNITCVYVSISQHTNLMETVEAQNFFFILSNDRICVDFDDLLTEVQQPFSEADNKHDECF